MAQGGTSTGQVGHRSRRFSISASATWPKRRARRRSSRRLTRTARSTTRPRAEMLRFAEPRVPVHRGTDRNLRHCDEDGAATLSADGRSQTACDESAHGDGPDALEPISNSPNSLRSRRRSWQSPRGVPIRRIRRSALSGDATPELSTFLHCGKCGGACGTAALATSRWARRPSCSRGLRSRCLSAGAVDRVPLLSVADADQARRDLELQPGEPVEVKSAEGIAAALDVASMNREFYSWHPNSVLWRHVASRVHHQRPDGKMLLLNDGIVLKGDARASPVRVLPRGRCTACQRERTQARQRLDGVRRPPRSLARRSVRP
jgi:hypothetical protein